MQAGDEVIVPVNTFIATAEAVSHVGAKPVFVDCLPDTAEVDAAKMEAAVTARTKALSCRCICMASPSTGRPSRRWRARHGLVVVEDACQAHGARYQGRPCGSLGTRPPSASTPARTWARWATAAPSPRRAPRSPSACGATAITARRTSTRMPLWATATACTTCRPPSCSSSCRHLAAWNRARQAAARRYDQLLAGVEGVSPLACSGDVAAVYHLYVVQVPERDRVRRRLQDAGVQTGIHYPVPLHLQPAYAYLGHHRGDFPVAEKMAGCILSLPMFPEITAEQQERRGGQLAAALA